MYNQGGQQGGVFWFYQNRLKVNLELYDRRIKTYIKCREAISLCVRNAGIDLNDAVKLLKDLDCEARFFFGKEITAYMNVLFKNCLELNSTNEQLQDHIKFPPNSKQRSEMTSKNTEILHFFSNQLDDVDQYFEVYLSFRHVY